MRVLTTVPQDDLAKVPAAAAQLEAEGYDGIVTMENRNNPFLPLAVAACATGEIELATGVSPRRLHGQRYNSKRRCEG